MKAILAAISGAAMLAACAGGSAPAPDRRTPGAELIGRSVTLETSAGQVSTLHFEDGGAVQAEFGGKQIAGNWVATGDRLCFAWSGNSRECWPYTAPFERGETATLTSDRGNVVKVTLR
jgi:hypothetical protein